MTAATPLDPDRPLTARSLAAALQSFADDLAAEPAADFAGDPPSHRRSFYSVCPGGPAASVRYMVYHRRDGTDWPVGWYPMGLFTSAAHALGMAAACLGRGGEVYIGPDPNPPGGDGSARRSPVTPGPFTPPVAGE